MCCCAAIYLVISGAYEAFIEFGASSTPRRTTVAELERQIPANRNLLIVGAIPVLKDGVEYWEKRGHDTETDDLYIPLADVDAPYARGQPRVFLRVSSGQFAYLREKEIFNPTGIHGIRMTGWDMPSKAKGFLQQRFGPKVLDGLVVIDIQRKLTGPKEPLLKIGGGLILAPFAIFFSQIVKKTVFLVLWIPYRIKRAIQMSLGKTD